LGNANDYLLQVASLNLIEKSLEKNPELNRLFI